MESGGIPVSGTRNSRVQRNARYGVLESGGIPGKRNPEIPESTGMPGVEFWSPVEFRVSATQSFGARWNSRSGVMESRGILDNFIIID